MTFDIKTYIDENYEEMLDVLRDLCRIPAPSHHECARARYCVEWLCKKGAKDVYTDEALNVIFPINCDGSDEITVFVAHTDTVFPDTEPMELREDDEKIYCPGVGDDTASVAVLLMCAKYFVEKHIVPPKGIMFVCNSCEEGLGNLKGTRQLFGDFEGRIAQFVSFDGASLTDVADRCVGSHRYEVEVLTEGGHSFGKFGNANAIHELSKIVTQIYKVEIPAKEGAKTTYNVGNIEGGTSVNTIAQSAKMMCEYRSSDKDCLDIMKNRFEGIFEAAKSDEAEVNVSKIGDRPCGNIDDSKVEKLRRVIAPIIEQITGEKVDYKLSSTDCNIPLSLGIAAICIGVFNGGGAHTREEWIEKRSLKHGLEIGIKTMLDVTNIL